MLPSELQALPKLEGCLTIAGGTPPARAKIESKGYLEQAERFVPKCCEVTDGIEVDGYSSREIGLIPFGPQLLFGMYLDQFSYEPVTAKKICVENERLLQVEGLNDSLELMSLTAFRGTTARNGKPE